MDYNLYAGLPRIFHGIFRYKVALDKAAAKEGAQYLQ
tara:strand:+ start:210 stop:320 length:111 start_codon:yes stop_codon:yes gene_type:complete